MTVRVRGRKRDFRASNPSTRTSFQPASKISGEKSVKKDWKFKREGILKALCGLSSAMSFGSSRRLMCSSSLVVVLVIFVLQIWVCSDCNCKAGAIRLLKENGLEKLKESSDITKDSYKSKEKHFRKYFDERINTSYGFNKTEKGFEESKRRVPSCPDPLHN